MPRFALPVVPVFLAFLPPAAGAEPCAGAPPQDPELARVTRACPWIDLSHDAARRELVAFEPPPTPHQRPPVLAPDGTALVFEPATAQRNARLVAPETGATRVLPAALSGTAHRAVILPDGRWLVAFLDTHPGSELRGHLVAWVGTHDDLRQGREGAFRALLLRADQLGENVQLHAVSLGPDGSVGMLVTGSAVPAGRAWRVQFSAAQLDALVPTRGYRLPTLDLAADAARQVVVDREAGQYLGHPTTCLLEDGRTILCVYPEGHGRGAIVFKRSPDGGRTWSERLSVPASWATSREVPTIHRTIDPRTGEKRLILWSGLYPARRAVSEDDGETWSELEPVGTWGGIVVMGFVERLRDGRYLAMFHDDGRFFTAAGRGDGPVVFTLYQTFSADGGLTWSDPAAIWSGSDVHLCEPGCVRSPDGTTLAVLLRENARRRNSYVVFSRDEGATWSPPRELPASLTGDRHTGKYAPDGRLVISFRDRTHESPTTGDWVAWVGTFEDLLLGREGQYRVRLADNTQGADCAYPGVEVLRDGTFVLTTYGHWTAGEAPWVLSVRLTLAELDALAREDR